MLASPICEMLGIDYPVLQGGMAWISDGKLAAAVSEGGGLGIISAMNAEAGYLREQIRIARTLTDRPFGVNIMLMSPHADAVAAAVVEEGVPVVTTGAGSPVKYMEAWKKAGICVLPVVASVASAKMAARAGADALIAEGQESGGHIGELTTMALVPQVCDAVEIPVPAALPTGAGWRPHLCWVPAGSRWEHGFWLRRNAASIRIIRIWSCVRAIYRRLRRGAASAAIPVGASRISLRGTFCVWNMSRVRRRRMWRTWARAHCAVQRSRGIPVRAACLPDRFPVW